jgi:hypothetical protein
VRTATIELLPVPRTIPLAFDANGNITFAHSRTYVRE